MVKTTSIILQTLCVPCGCRCRYCMLSWDGRTIGAGWERSRRYAAAFADWIRENRPELRFHFSFGYSMEHPSLPEALDFLHALGSVGADYLHKAGKPSKKGYLKACDIMGIKPSEALAVGDQIFTDIWGAGRSGIRSCMVDPIDPREEIQIKLKRKLEKPFLAIYRAKRRGS